MSERPQNDLTSLSSLEAAARERSLPAHIEHLLREAQDAAPEQAAVLRTIAAALQIDLAFLHAHPEDLFAALFMRCGLYDSVEGERLGAPGPEAPTRGALSALAQRWRHDYEQRGRPWVQTLLPPEHGPGGPLVAELRGVSGWDLCGLSNDGDVFLRSYRQHGPNLYRSWCVRTGTVSETDEATCNAVSPGPASLHVKFGRENTATLCNTALGTEHELSVPEYGDVSGHAFSADARLLVLCGYVDMYVCGFVQVYETATGRLLHDFKSERAFVSDTPRITPCGRYVIAVNDKGLHLWDLTKSPRGKVAAELFDLPGTFPKVEISADGRRMAVSDSWGMVWLYDLADLRAVTRGLDRHLRHLCFSPDGSRVLVGDWLCDGETGRRIRRLRFPPYGDGYGDSPPRNSFSFGSARIVDLTDGVRVWSSATGVCRRSAKSGAGENYIQNDVVAFTRDGRCYAVSGEGQPLRRPEFGVAQVREAMRTGGEAAVERLYAAPVDTRPVSVRDADSGAVRATLPAHGATALAFSTDGRLLATGTREGLVEIWDTGTWARVSSPRAHGAPIATLCFSEDGRMLASAGDHEALRVSRVADGSEIATRPLGEKDPTYSRPIGREKVPVYEKRSTWEPSEEALQQLRAWVGFAATPAPVPRYRAEVKDDITCIVDTTIGATVARLPHQGRWAAHPRAAIWAGPSAHLHLRGAP